MPATSKSGGKNRKFGRHSRNPSSKLYASTRAERNRHLRIERHLARMGLPHRPASDGLPCPPHPHKPFPLEFARHTGLVPEHRGPWYAAMLDGRILSCGSLTECTDTRKQSMDPRVYIVRRDGSTLNRIEV